MSDKLQKLTKQIYEEGVGKAKAEANKVIESAQAEKKKILRSARQEAEDIISVAHREAEDLKKKVDADLRMATQQSLALIKQKITDLICVKVSETSVAGLMDDAEFLKNILEAVIKDWGSITTRSSEEFLLKLPANMQKDIQKQTLAKSSQALQKGLTIEFDNTVNKGFEIQAKDGSFKIGFTEDDFKAFIQNLLRPGVKKFLFKS